MNKIKHKIIKFIYPKNVYGIVRILHFVMKITGLFPLKVKKTKFGRTPVFCKWGILSTVCYLILYFACLFHVIFFNLPKMKEEKKMDTEIVGLVGHGSQFIIESFTTLVLMYSIFPLIKFEKFIYETLHKIEILVNGLNIDYGATMKRARFLVASTILMQIFVFFVGALLTIYGSGDYNALDFLFVVIFPHLIIVIKVVSITTYVSILNFGFIEMEIFMRNILRDM